jgi:hypothetical protein
MEVYVPLATHLVQDQFSLPGWTKQPALTEVDALEMTLGLPRQLHGILGDIERGGLEITIQPASFDPYFARLEHLINRAILALAAATFTISAALLVVAFHPPHWDWVTAPLFVLALMAALVFGVYVLMQLMRTHR